ncbi:hypothetical protein ZOSMA_189G00220 [Zostera marina]|uniref:J domain-containing protein n=1 Tax=Zostera marina TaxID=29655 RepID=A0A0K9PQ12_ZOSMR|nr:hypothetical protein ZOSMA_189G00220 [Zostera marina]
MGKLLQQFRQYALPLFLLTAGIFFQLIVLPSSIPYSHYDVLGIERLASNAQVEDAYQKFESRWNSGKVIPKIDQFIKIRYAFEILTNPIWKRDYDHFGIDEHLHIIETLKVKYKGEIFSKINLPLLAISSYGSSYNKLTYTDFASNIRKTKVWLIQVYSSGSPQSAEFSNSWNNIVNFLDGIVDTAVVELGELGIASFLAERRYTGQPFFRNGLPALISFPPNCRNLDCCFRYDGDNLSEDAVIDWMTTTILSLPRIFYYSKESLGKNFIAKSGQHKVKVIFFSRTGQRALPFQRKAARDYHDYASFAFVLWQDEDAPFWFKKFEVESAPATLLLKDPGVKPIVYYGTWNSSSFINIMEQNKHHDLPQLRSITSMELGCDAKGRSRAGDDSTAWYCVVLSGRLSLQLSIMRDVMRRVHKNLVDYGSLSSIKDDFSDQGLAAVALKEKRLTLTWLDGELQSTYCSFYLHSETSYETCGPRRYADIDDVPLLFLVRYRRNSTENNLKGEKKKKSIWDLSQDVEDSNLASQLVARYNGSEDVSEIIKWISQTIKDGDTRDLPYFRTQTPELIPENADSVLLKSIQGVISSGGMKKRLKSINTSIYDHVTDPRLGPFMLLGACLSFGAIYLQKNQTNSQDNKDESKPKRQRVKRTSSSKNRPPSITDAIPKDAEQILLPDSDPDSD